MFMVARGLIGLLITPRSFSVASLRPVPVTSGLILLCAYFAASLATALPFIPIRLLFRVGLILHYGVFPASLAFIVLLGMPSDYYTPFSSFGIYLVAGSAFALLSFRMYELRQTFDRDA